MGVDMLAWGKNRGLVPIVAVLLVAEVIAVLTVGTQFQIPSLLGLQGLEVPIGFFLPLVAIVGFGVSMERQPYTLERRSRRPVRVWDGVFAGVLVGLIALPAAWDSAATWLGAACSTATGIGIVMMLRRAPAGTRALVPSGWIFFGVLTGRSYGHDAWWNWPVAAWPSPVALNWAAGAMAAGFIVHLSDR